MKQTKTTPLKQPKKELIKQESTNHSPNVPESPSPISPLSLPESSPRKRWFWWAIAAAAVVFLAAVSAGGYVAYNRYFKAKGEEKKPATALDFKSNIGSLVQVKGAAAQNFASFEAEKVNVTPKVASYKIEKDLENVENKEQFSGLTAAAQNLLEKNAFVVTEGNYKEFFQIYENNRYDSVPNFITVDSVLHNFHLLFDYSLKKLEEEKLIQALRELDAGMLTTSETQLEALRGTAWENAALRNVAFFTVATKLLEPAAPVGGEVADVVGEELNLIEKREGITESPLMNKGQDSADYREDYSQYIPRGHYSKSEDLQRYFKTMMWYGRMTFRQKSEDETRSAILASLALGQKEANFTNWEKIYEPTNFFVGKSDDITFYQYLEILRRVYGDDINLDKLLSNDNFIIFMGQAKDLAPPQINSMPIFDESINPDREQEIKGFRVMGQRFTIDASIFQRLIYREVKENKKGQRRMLPEGLDIPAALGSEEAYSILKAGGADDYQNYPENMRKMREYLSGLDQGTWTQNLYWGWLYSLNPILLAKGEGYPEFMQNEAWTRKNLNGYLGSWTELKHDTILYAKQVYAEMGGAPPEEYDDRGYVEPEPEVYARLAGLAKMLAEGLEMRGILSEEQKENINQLKEIADQLKIIAEKELEGKGLSAEEYNFIRFYGGELEHLWLSVMKDENVQDASEAQDHPAALVADVATDPNGVVLEEATGNVFPIYVVAPVEGKLKIAKGGIYSHYEFMQPLSNRLTDEEWWKILSGESGQKMPSLPKWTESFIAE